MSVRQVLVDLPIMAQSRVDCCLAQSDLSPRGSGVHSATTVDSGVCAARPIFSSFMEASLTVAMETPNLGVDLEKWRQIFGVNVSSLSR